MKAFTIIEFLITLTIIAFLAFIILAPNDRVVVIDGCEYIRHFGGRDTSLTHKGNCTNSIHQYNK